MSSTVVKSGIWYTASSFLVKGIGFITLPIFTRLMTQADIGIFSTFQAWLGVFGVLATLQLHDSLISAKFDYSTKMEQYCLTLALSEFALAIIWLVLANLFAPQFQGIMSLSQTEIDLLFVYLMFQPGVTLFQIWERFRFEYKKTVAVSVWIAIATALLSVILVIFLADKLFGRIIGLIVPMIITGFALLCFFIWRGKRPKWSMLVYALPITLPLVPHSLSGVILSTFDRVMISWWCSIEAVALYSIAYSCGMIVNILATSMNSAFGPWLGDMITENNEKAVRSKTPPFVLLFATLASIMVLFGPEIIWILGGSSYEEAKYVIPPVALGCMYQFLYMMYVNIELRLKKTLGIAVASIAAAVLNLVLNVLLIPQFGYISAAYTTAAGYAFMLIFHYLMVKRLGYQNYYGTKFIAAVTAGMTLFVLFANFLYSNFLVRMIAILIIVIVIALLIFRKRKIILGLIRRKES